MTRAEYILVRGAIRTLRRRVIEQQEMCKEVEARFVKCYLENLREHLNEFERRLEKEVISGEVPAVRSLPAPN